MSDRLGSGSQGWIEWTHLGVDRLRSGWTEEWIGLGVGRVRRRRRRRRREGAGDG